jgi:hypothetical protein
LYHNLVPDKEATSFWRLTKPLLVYFTLVDFGKLTTLTEMRQCMQKLTDKPFTMKPLLECGLGDMHFLAKLAVKVVNFFKPGAGNRQISQYLVEVNFDEENNN